VAVVAFLDLPSGASISRLLPKKRYLLHAIFYTLDFLPSSADAPY